MRSDAIKVNDKSQEKVEGRNKIRVPLGISPSPLTGVWKCIEDGVHDTCYGTPRRIPLVDGKVRPEPTFSSSHSLLWSPHPQSTEMNCSAAHSLRRLLPLSFIGYRLILCTGVTRWSASLPASCRPKHREQSSDFQIEDSYILASASHSPTVRVMPNA